MKNSNATCEKATGSPPLTGRSSDSRPTPTTANSFGLGGPSCLPDPRYHAFRRDLADLALAGQVIASHYAAPVDRTAAVDSVLREGPSEGSAEIGTLRAGEGLAMLDDTLGWAWGYAGEERIVGYVRSEALTAA